MVFAINKIDKPNANADHIKEQLSRMNYLVESWGGKYQDQEISAKGVSTSTRKSPSGRSCGLNIESYNDIKVGDIIRRLRTNRSETEITTYSQ